jgi:iron(III) transport system substrate-binding protein
MFHRSRQIVMILVGTMSLALVLSGVVPSLAAEAPILSQLEGADRARVAKLIEAARQEGSVTVLNPLFSDHTARLFDTAFRSLYGLGDDFKLVNIRKGTGRVVATATQEMRANKLTFDVVIVSAPPFYIGAAKAGLFVEYTSPYWTEFGFDTVVQQAGQMADPPRFVTPFAYAFQPVWNRKCPGFADVNITSYQDLLNPKFKGKTIVSDIPKSFTYSSLWLALREQMDLVGYMTQYRDITEPITMFRTEPKMQKVISCERPIDMWNLAGRVYQNRLKDASLDLGVGVFKEGMLMHGNYMAIPKGAPHPNAAKLFYDFLLRPEGQTELIRGEAVYSFMLDFTPPPEVQDLITPLAELKLLPLDWQNVTKDRLEDGRKQWKSVFLK